MKKHILTLVLLYLLAPFALANVVTGVAEIPENYYADVDGKKGMDNIINALNAIISNHTVLNYNSLEDYYERTDFYADTLWDMYSTCRFTMSHANIPQSEVCDGWNKEHLVCQSWFSGSGGMGSDLFNVYPTDARVNNIRSSYPYGEVWWRTPSRTTGSVSSSRQSCIRSWVRWLRTAGNWACGPSSICWGR